jgi:hypothetical protein
VDEEIWVYNFGPNRLMQRIRFRNGILASTERCCPAPSGRHGVGIAECPRDGAHDKGTASSRFGLVAHSETQDLPAYVLRIDAGGSKLDPVTPTEGPPGVGRSRTSLPVRRGSRTPDYGTISSTIEWPIFKTCVRSLWSVWYRALR